jgi:hypothetical protein
MTSQSIGETGDVVMGPGPEHALLHFSTIASELGVDRLAGEAESIADRIGAGQFYVACVGQFKRGKSTLLDALIGDSVLPMGIVPVTAVPTVLRYGRQRTARVRLASGTWRDVDPDCLAEWVSEEHNPENVKRVAGVEVFVSAPLLSTGMCLVDTPGLGSVFEGNAELTREFVPNIDAALVVIGADPPLTGDELSLIEDVARHVTSLLFVLNKSDRVSETERETAIAFARSVLERRLRRPVPRIYEISATERLLGAEPTRDWQSLQDTLADLARHSRVDLVRAAGDRAVKRIAGQLLASIDEQRTALLAPIEQTERRVATLDAVMCDAERSMIELGYLLFAEQQRLSRTFAADREEFLARTTPVAHRDLAKELVDVPFRWGPGLRRGMLARTQEIARTHVTPWLAEQQANAEDAYRRASARFIELGNTFLARLASTACTELTHLGSSLDRDQGFRVRSSFYFNDLIHIAQPASPFRLVLDILLGLLGMRAPFERASHRFLDRLLVMNATRVQSDVEDRVVESRRALEADIRRVLVEVRTGAARALENARAAHAAGTGAVQDALSRLDRLEQQVRESAGLIA